MTLLIWQCGVEIDCPIYNHLQLTYSFRLAASTDDYSPQVMLTTPLLVLRNWLARWLHQQPYSTGKCNLMLRGERRADHFFFRHPER